MSRVLVAGVSTRAAATSAARAGFAVTAIDAFGDLDQAPSVRTVSLAPPFTARGAALAGQTVECDAVVYLSSFENHPKAISALADGRALWGNSPAVVRRVRDPLILAETLRARGFAAPEVRVSMGSGFSRTMMDETVGLKPEPTSSINKWLVKPLASGGGQRIHLWDRATPLPRGCYLQELIDGISGSVVFAAAAGRAVAVGVSRQLVGETAFGAEGFQYCGNILTAADDSERVYDDTHVEAACALAQAVADEFGLVGVNGIDFVSRDGSPYAVEVNPRWCASMELVERAYGFSVFAAHVSACTTGLLPAFDLKHERRDSRAIGKAVVYARRDVTVGDTRTWLTKQESIRDVPQPGARIAAGRPVCTIFADAADGRTCHDALVENADRVYAQLDAWSE